MNLYIVLEGIDGSGKTTQANALREYFTIRNKRVFVFHEPTYTKAGLIIKEMINKNSRDKYSPETISLAFALDRMMYKDEVLEKIIKSNRYDLIIGDRSFYSSIVYQSLQGVDVEWLKLLNNYVIKPDIVFVLEISIEEQMKRRGESNIIYEKREFQEKLIEEYKKLKEYFPNDEIHYINGEKAIDDITKEIAHTIEDKLKGD